LLLLNITAPTYIAIISCLDAQKISTLVPPIQVNNNPNNFRCSASFLLAPWVLEAILGTDLNDPATLLLATNDAANKFDHLHEMDTNYTTDAEEQHAQVTKWLWAIQAGLIPRTNYSVEPNNDNLTNYMELQHSQHIIPHNNLFGVPPPQQEPHQSSQQHTKSLHQTPKETTKPEPPPTSSTFSKYPLHAKQEPSNK
jgi:hypothetical protein